MKKFISLLVIAVMLISLLPTNIFAMKSTYDHNTEVTFNDFSVKNTSNTTESVANLNYNKYYLFESAGTGADFEPVTGMFGKEATDISAKISRLTASASSAYVHTRSKILPDDNTLPAGAITSIRWNWAFGDMNAERYVNATFYPNASTSYNDKSSFSYSGSTKLTDILRLSPDGRVRFFGKTLSKNLYLDLNKWYNFEIQIVNGTATDSANSVAGTKSKASLYVDGIFIGEKEINNAADSSTTIAKQNGIATLNFESKGVKYSGSTTCIDEITYLDDIETGYYQTNAVQDRFVRFDQSLALSSKSDNYITDDIHISFKEDMTVADFLADVSYNKRTDAGGGVYQTGIAEVKILDENMAEVTDTSVKVQPGWYARIKVEGAWSASSSRAVYRYYYRKITDHITYFLNSFEGSTAVTTSANNASVTVGTWHNEHKYELSYNKGLKQNNGAFAGETHAYVSSGHINKAFITHSLPNLIPHSKYVVELSVMRQKKSGNYGEAKLTMGSYSMLSLTDGGLYLYNGSSFIKHYDKNEKGTDKWYHLAVEVDTVQNIAKLYLNGEDTGYSRTISTSSNGWIGDIKLTVDNIASGDLGTLYVDNFKVYSGTYKISGITITSDNNNVTPETNETVTVAGDISVADFKTSTGAACIYTYSDGAFVSEVTEGNVADGDVAVFKDNNGLIRYLDIELLPVVSNIEFKEESGKVIAIATIENRSAIKKIDSAMLVIAKRNDSEVFVAVSDEKMNISSLGVHTFTTEIEYVDGDKIVAYFWDGDLKPFENSKKVYQAN